MRERVGKWLDVTAEPSKSGKTRVWTLHPTGFAGELGTVSWYGPWRCYAFAPKGGTIYERDCLRTIATLCEEKTREHREAAKQRRQVERG